MSKYFSPLDPIVIIYIFAKTITFFTNGKSLPNFVYLLSETHFVYLLSETHRKYLNIGSEFV